MGLRTKIYTYGVWDLFHYGHLRMLRQAKLLGGKLIIGVFTDRVAESFKRKPIMTENERYRLLHELGWGTVVFQDELLPIANIKQFKPDIVAKGVGAGWEYGVIPQFDGIKSVLLDYTPNISTTDILKRINARGIEQSNQQDACPRHGSSEDKSGVGQDG